VAWGAAEDWCALGVEEGGEGDGKRGKEGMVRLYMRGGMYNMPVWAG
jgi:hypothetical protein